MISSQFDSVKLMCPNYTSWGHYNLFLCTLCITQCSEESLSILLVKSIIECIFQNNLFYIITMGVYRVSQMSGSMCIWGKISDLLKHAHTYICYYKIGNIWYFHSFQWNCFYRVRFASKIILQHWFSLSCSTA